MELNHSTTGGKYLDFTIVNYNFLQRVSKHKKEMQCIDFVELRNNVRRVVKKMKNLSVSELDQWVEVQELKIKQLYACFPDQDRPAALSRQGKLDDYGNILRQSLHSLALISKQLQNYNSKLIAQIIQSFYTFSYGEQIHRVMQQVGYKVTRNQTLQYQQPSRFSLCCCWERTD